MENSIAFLLSNFQKIRTSLDDYYQKSRNFRIMSICFASIPGYLMGRYVYYTLKKRIYKTPPGPIGAPFIGASFKLLQREYLIELATSYGNVVSCFLGPSNLILINEPRLARKYFSHPRSLRMAFPENDATFFFTNGKVWADRRRIIFANLMSTMRANYVEKVTKKFIKSRLFPIIDENIKQDKSTNVRPLFRPIGFNIILQACFGKELASLDDPFWKEWDRRTLEDQKYAQLRNVIGNILGNNNRFSCFIQRVFTGDDIQTLSIFNQHIDALDAFARNKKHDVLMDEEMKQDQDIKLFNDYIEDYVNDEKGAIYTRRHLLGDMALMFAAATDTTYSALSFALLVAAKYPQLQQELYEELIAAYGDNVDDIQLKDKGISKIPKLRAFIHESLRMNSPVNLSGFRRLEEDGVELDGYLLPKDSMTMINVVAINKNPKYWIKGYDAEKHGNVDMDDVHLEFWMDDDGKFNKKKNSANFFTFHIGKRDCAGQSLAMKELMIVLAMIFMTYKVERFDGKTGFEIKPMFGGGIMEPTVKDIRFIKRE